MLNLQTANENNLLPDQSENAVWLYAGIAAAILMGGGVILFFLVRIVAYRFCKSADSRAKSHKTSYKEVPLLDLQPVVPIPQPPTTDTPPKVGTAPPAYMPKISFAKLLQKN